MVDIFKVGLLLGSKLRPTLLENRLAIKSILGLRRDHLQRSASQPELEINDLSVGVRLWLSRKGFSSKEHLQSLQKNANGDLTLGLMAIVGVLASRAWAPKAPRGPTGRVLKSSERTCPAKFLGRFASFAMI